ncbi:MULTISPECIES: DUF3307 domain-containing protein [unclassified Streptomyces]|uniref:DUF3307 domain-containing protein n=1 Tax=unclassified Streptomyces TaxID=2593676 RepID=UPI0022555544|nr:MULTISPECIES: DUF3307 domain-containing protein [unclassified Streptomyces]MCX4863476.1 DUF3307 domain-containing protein [Streptomyces sp. NBC_00906]MCX4894714.1 DUF3307 domain-containing protein [Streptomyces sp. NBC_00892]
MFAALFVLLYVAHLLADYPFQTDHQAGCKAEKSAAGWRANLVHAGTHVLTTAAALAVGFVVLDLPLTVPAAAVALLWIGATHSIIDRRWPVLRWMERTGQVEFVKHGGAAHVDQTAHITALLIAALALAA